MILKKKKKKKKKILSFEFSQITINQDSNCDITLEKLNNFLFKRERGNRRKTKKTLKKLNNFKKRENRRKTRKNLVESSKIE
jgi:hypothetical protein